MADAILEEPIATIPGQPGGGREPRHSMKLVSCIVRPERLEAVKDALSQLGIIGGMNITDVRGFGRQKGQVEHYRGGEYTIRFIPKVKIDIAVPEDGVDRVLAVVGDAARTGQVGDGKVFVMDLRAAMRIRTGERGVVAL